MNLAISENFFLSCTYIILVWLAVIVDSEYWDKLRYDWFFFTFSDDLCSFPSGATFNY